jgi:hypothetical protein
LPDTLRPTALYQLAYYLEGLREAVAGDGHRVLTRLPGAGTHWRVSALRPTTTARLRPWATAGRHDRAICRHRANCRWATGSISAERR